MSRRLRRATSPLEPCRLRTGVLAALLLAAPLLAAVDPARMVGRPLAEVLDELRESGLPLIFSSRLVTPEMRVEVGPQATSGRELVEELLAPHRLAVRVSAGERWVVVRTRPPGRGSGVEGRTLDGSSGLPLAGTEVVVVGAAHRAASDAAGRFRLPPLPPGTYRIQATLAGFLPAQSRVEIEDRTVDLDLFLELAPTAREEIVVSDSPHDDGLGTWTFDRGATGRAGGGLGGGARLDPLRSLEGLPGISSTASTAAFGVRGSEEDGVTVLVDGQEVVEPYHLRQFGGIPSIVAATLVDRLEVHRSGVPAGYGDRLGGVVELRTFAPEKALYAELTADLESLQLGAAGIWGPRSHQWIASLRAGEPEVVSEIGESNERPRYWDALAKLRLQLVPAHRLEGHALVADDEFEFRIPSREEFVIDNRNRVAWLTHAARLGPSTGVVTRVSYTRVGRIRLATELGRGFTIIDDRGLDRAGVRQSWDRRLGSHHLGFGWEARFLSSTYDYADLRTSDVGPSLLVVLGEPFSDVRSFSTRLEGRRSSAFVTDRWRISPRLSAELGLRYDVASLTDDRHLAPRLALAADVGGGTLRLVRDVVYQSQRPYELQVPDGETVLQGAERGEQLSLGYARRLSGVDAAVEVFARRVEDPRPRFHNLFKPVSRFPELESDRVLLAPQRRSVRGAELMLSGGDPSTRLEWRVAYGWSRARDLYAEEGWIPGPGDQTHSLRLDLVSRLPHDWVLRFAWLGSSGLPTTSVAEGSRINELGIPAPILGPLFAERRPDRHRLDLTASRSWSWPGSSLHLDLVVENVYDRKSTRGYDLAPVSRPGEEGEPGFALTPELDRGLTPGVQLRLRI